MKAWFYSVAQSTADSTIVETLFNTLKETAQILSAKALGFTYGEMLTAFLIILFTVILRKFVVKWLFKRFHSIARYTNVSWDDKVIETLEGPVSFFVLLLGVFVAFMQLPFEPTVIVYANKIFQAIAIALIFWAVFRLLTVISEELERLALSKGHSIGTFMPLINKTVRFFLLFLAFSLIIQNFGIKIGPVLGALGIGGAAFAFAAKDTIANIYGSFALALDRPFRVGDWIIVGDRVDGQVEEIGLRSTKIRTWPKTLMSIPNNVLANEIIDNWSRMPKRRVKQIIGVTYQSSPEDMDALVEDIRNLLKGDEGVEQSFILVNFTDFGASSLDILVYYFTDTIAWLEHMDIRQRINLKIMKAVKARGMSIAFPTRTLHLEGDVAEKIANSAINENKT